MKDEQAVLRQHVLDLLRGGAHVDFDTAIANLPPKLCGGQLALLTMFRRFMKNPRSVFSAGP